MVMRFRVGRINEADAAELRDGADRFLWVGRVVPVFVVCGCTPVDPT